jgi:hypothetical protein
VVKVPWLPEVTPKGVPLGARMCNGKLGFPALFRVFSDMLCSTPRPRSHCVVFLLYYESNGTFYHPIEDHSAFIQACDWLYIEAALTFICS